MTVKVRIRRKPQERELDGVRLDRLRPGTVREVSSVVGAWLVASGYAEPEMRESARPDEDETGFTLTKLRDSAADRPRRRSTDR
jgi:hypothetical protein